MDKFTIDCSFEIKGVSEDGRIEGHGAAFGNVDFGMDRIEHGAFKEWLKTADSVPMLWQHFSDEPIGVWDTMHEDQKGLFVSGQLNLSKDSGEADVPMAWKARALAKQGAVTGLSIGYFAKDFRFEEDVRVLEKVDVAEVSLATFPMNDQARVVGVKNWTRAELEKALRERFGLSRKAASIFASKGFSGLEEAESRESALAESRKAASTDDEVVVWEAIKQRQERLRA